MWLNNQVSYYQMQTDRTGKAETLRDILFSNSIENFDSILALRNLDSEQPGYDTRAKEIKSTLPMFSPSALLQVRKNDPESIISHSGLMQLDFDQKDISDYDIEELKRCVFSLPFIAYCGLSCSGRGFYALVAISEPDRQRDYAEHLFNVFSSYGIKPDMSKGRNVNDCRYVSWDGRYLLREDPEPLRITHFKPKESLKKKVNINPQYSSNRSNSGLINTQVKRIQDAVKGQRWLAVQQSSFTLGGIGDYAALELLESAIMNNSEFSGEEEKYIKCARDCFRDGSLKPLQ